MNEHLDDLLSAWLDDADENLDGESELSSHEASESVAESLLIHGLLTGIGKRDNDQDAERVQAVMNRIDLESDSSAVSVQAVKEPQRRRVFAILTSVGTIAIAIAVAFVAFGPQQRVSAAMASLEQIVEAAAKPFDRTYRIRLVEEYPRDKRPRNLSQEAWDREAPEQIDGAMLYVRGPNEFVMTVLLKTGVQRTSGCDGQQSWSFREDSPVHVSTELNRFRGRMPGNQQDIPFINIHENLSQLRIGYDIELTDNQETGVNGTVLSQLVCLRKQQDVRGTKRVEIWFDQDTGTVQKMLLDGLPRGRGGPKSVMLELVGQSDLPVDFFSHESHHEPGRRVKSE